MESIMYTIAVLHGESGSIAYVIADRGGSDWQVVRSFRTQEYGAEWLTAAEAHRSALNATRD